jgi:hypothetical protein
MTEERLVLAELLEKTGDGDFLRAVAEAVLQLLMETDVEGLIGTGRYERTTWLAQRLSRPHPRHAARGAAAAHPETAAGQLFSAVSGSAQDIIEPRAPGARRWSRPRSCHGRRRRRPG